MRWSGKSWGAPTRDPAEHVETPVGAECTWCNEPIEADDQGVEQPYVRSITNGCQEVGWIRYHLECHLRQVFGSVGHQKGMCICFKPRGTPGLYDDPEGMTRREAAQA